MFPHQEHFYPPQEHHFHYHYHYHTDPPQSQPIHSRQRCSSRIIPQKTQRVTSPRMNPIHASSIQGSNWKQHVNPEVSRLYSSIQPRLSRFSEDCHRISQEDSIMEDPTPTKQTRMLETQCDENTTLGDGHTLGKLESLYYARQAGRRRHEVESISSEPDEAFFSVHEEKLRGYRRQVERLKRIEEECQYLRDHFMLHVEIKHPRH